MDESVHKRTSGAGPGLNRTGKLLCAVLLSLAITACSQAPNLVGVGDPLPNADTATRGGAHRIYIATTRAPSDEEGVFFSGQRSQRLRFASIDVSIPPSHRPGEIALPRGAVPDPNKHMVLYDPRRIASADDFVGEMNRAVAARSSGRRSAMVFVHGYNTNLTEAVARLAQFVEDSGYQGIPILFSWPSTRRTIDYVADINSAAISRDAMGHLALLLETTRLDGFDLVAHSMGNFLTMEAMRTLSLKGSFNAIGKLNTVVLAAPDIDVDLFVRQFSAVPEGDRRKFVILASQDDVALKAARRIAGDQPRLGAAPPETISNLGVVVIDLTEIEDTASINHSKFANSEEIVQLVGQRLAKGETLSTEDNAGSVFVQKVGNLVNVAPVQ